MAEIGSLARRYRAAIESISPGGRRVFELELMHLWMGDEAPLAGLPYPDAAAGASLSEILWSLAGIAVSAADQAKTGLKGQTYWPAVVIVDEARELWWRDRRKQAPRSTKGSAAPPPFERFLGDLLLALGLANVTPAGAINAWARWSR